MTSSGNDGLQTDCGGDIAHYPSALACSADNVISVGALWPGLYEGNERVFNFGTAVTVLSLLLDNVTTVVIFGPLIILIAQTQKISPIPYLLAAALLGPLVTGDPALPLIGWAGALLIFGANVFLALRKWSFRQETAR